MKMRTANDHSWTGAGWPTGSRPDQTQRAASGRDCGLGSRGWEAALRRYFLCKGPPLGLRGAVCATEDRAICPEVLGNRGNLWRFPSGSGNESFVDRIV